jgi:FkbH-like protein
MNLSLSEIQQELKQVSNRKLQGYRIAVLRNITAESIIPYLQYYAFKSGFEAKVSIGNYDNILQDCHGGLGADNKPIFTSETDCILIFFKLEVFSWFLARDFLSLSPEKRESEIERFLDYVEQTLQAIRKQCSAVVLWHGLETPIYKSLGIMEDQMRDSQTSTLKRLEVQMKDIFSRLTNVFYVDLADCITQIGINSFYDNRFWHFGAAPYSLDALNVIAKEDFKYINALKGKNKKCLVLDCDNTLWGGIIDEDGIDGIKLSKHGLGGSFYDFQQELVNLHHRGVALALCSKNNEEDVWEVFDMHPEMLLKREHIAAYEINWEDKAGNIKKISESLNLGLDSFVFIDDSPFETDMVREILPQVEVILVDPKQSFDYRQVIGSTGYFDSLQYSAVDSQRTKMYQAESGRRKLQKRSGCIDEFLEKLGMEVTVKFADEKSIHRIAQLTQRTNQFNLTTKRYSDADIKKFVHNDTCDVLYLSLKDKYGDAGIVGAVILQFSGDIAEIDTFLLSCRVIGRGVENAFLSCVIEAARLRKVEIVRGEYLPTSKNQQVSDFYSRCGFDEKLRLNIMDNSVDAPAYFRSVVFD